MAARIPPEIEAEIVAAILRRDCAYRIAERFNVDYGTVVRVARRNDVELTKGHRRPNIDRLRQIQEADQQYGRQVAARMFKIDPTTVSKSVGRLYQAVDKVGVKAILEEKR